MWQNRQWNLKWDSAVYPAAFRGRQPHLKLWFTDSFFPSSLFSCPGVLWPAPRTSLPSRAESSSCAWSSPPPSRRLVRHTCGLCESLIPGRDLLSRKPCFGLTLCSSVCQETEMSKARQNNTTHPNLQELKYIHTCTQNIRMNRLQQADSVKRLPQLCAF